MDTTTAERQRTLVIERTFDAPAHLVFSAWAKPEHLVRWFGPNDFTLPTCEQDFRVGGKYNFCMQAPDGTDHWVRGEYHEISEFDRLVFTWTRDDGQLTPWVDNIVTLMFEEQDGRTKMTLHQALFATEQFRNEHTGGWSECLERLTDFIKTQLN
ncbi:MAG: SRPBCC domain-containing protein [Flavobacteriales bacterium]|nr:SRPBCC domain-containing protein [Flavobacteriales bacterium]